MSFSIEIIIVVLEWLTFLQFAYTMSWCVRYVVQEVKCFVTG